VTTHELSVPRTARYHVLGELGGDRRELWIVLHGYGQLAGRFLSGFEPVAAPGRLIVAPEGLSRFYLRGTGGRVGASWMTREDRAAEIGDYVGYLDRLHAQLTGGRADVRLGVLGFSQGAAAALRWAVLGQPRPARAILWSGGVPPDLDPERARAALADTRVELVVGESDEAFTEEKVEEELASLRDLAPGAQLARFAGGHQLDAETLARRFSEG
jgi:predicted esterase